MSYRFKKIFSFCLPYGKADATPFSALPRASGKWLQRRPRTPWNWSTLDFRSIRVKKWKLVTIRWMFS